MPAYFNKSETRVALSWIALLRIMLGLVFISTWAFNLADGFYTPQGLLRFFSEIYPQSENPLGWYASFINGVILPAREVFAPFQLVAELLLGVALLIGFLTPLSSLAGIFFLLNTMLATFGNDWLWAYLMPMGILGVTALTQAGRALGVDAVLLRRFGERSRLLW